MVLFFKHNGNEPDLFYHLGTNRVRSTNWERTQFILPPGNEPRLSYHLGMNLTHNI